MHDESQKRAVFGYFSITEKNRFTFAIGEAITIVDGQDLNGDGLSPTA
jgi:hypothetical protein